MQYEVIGGWTNDEYFLKEVNKRLDDGWKLYGYPFANEQGYFQAMIRIKEEK